MKLHHYNQMMAHLTQRQKFSKGGDATILPQPNPLSPTERNQKVFYDYVGRMKHYLTGAEMPEWFVKDLILKKAEELGVELKAAGGRTGFNRAGMAIASNPLFRGTTGPNQILKAPRGKTGMADILKHEGAATLALGINQLNKPDDDGTREIIQHEGGGPPPLVEPPQDPDESELVKRTVEEVIKDRIQKNAPKHKEQASDEYLNAFRELVDFHEGSVAKAIRSSGLDREYIRAKFYQRDQEIKGTGGQITETIEPLEITKIFKDYTNDINKDSSIIDTIYNEALETGRIKKEEKYYNIKDVANIIGMDISKKGPKNQLLDLLMENVRKTDEGRSLAKKYHIDDVVNKVKEWSSDKQIVGGEPSTSKRYKFEQTKDAPLSKELTTIKTRIADLTKAEGTYDKDLEQIEHAGHLESLRTEERYQDLFKNLNTIQDMIFQDGFVNKDIIQNKGHAGDMESIYKELDALRGQKNINKELIKIQEKIDARLKKTQKQIRDHKEYTIGKNQDKRIARIKINLPKKGEAFTGNNIVADLSKVDKRWIMGNVDLINSKAKKFDDLNDNQKEIYRANLNDQYLKMIGKIYKEVGYGKGEIEDIKETISEGTHSKKGVLEKAQGGPVYGKYADQIKNLKIS